MWDPLGTDLKISKILSDCMLSASAHIQVHSQGMNNMSVPTHGILQSCEDLWISNSVNLSSSWHVCCSLPAHFKHTQPIHYSCIWHACLPYTAHINLRISAGWHSSTLRNEITTLWFCLDRFNTWHTILKRRHNVVCTINDLIKQKCKSNGDGLPPWQPSVNWKVASRILRTELKLLLCLLVCLQSQMCSCTIYTATAAMSIAASHISTHIHTHKKHHLWRWVVVKLNHKLHAVK